MEWGEIESNRKLSFLFFKNHRFFLGEKNAQI